MHGAAEKQLPKEGENKLRFKNHHKQMKAPFVVYTDFESLIKKIHGCNKKDHPMLKTEVHGPCGFWYIIVRSDGERYGPFMYPGENAVQVFLTWRQSHEKWMREELIPKPIIMTKEDWIKFKTVTECHICNESIVKKSFRDAFYCMTPTRVSIAVKAINGAISPG